MNQDFDERPICGQIAPLLCAAPIFNLRGVNAHLCGFDMSQNYLAYPTWNYVILQERPSIVVELGTSWGGLSCLLGKTCEAIGCEFHTFDVVKHTKHADKYASHNVVFHQGNVLAAEGIAQVKDLLLKGKSILLCDNGKKVDEFNTFAPFIKTADIIAAHDYLASADMHPYWAWHETNPALIDESCVKYNLRPYLAEWFDRTAWIVRRREA